MNKGKGKHVVYTAAAAAVLLGGCMTQKDCRMYPEQEVRRESITVQ